MQIDRRRYQFTDMQVDEVTAEALAADGELTPEQIAQLPAAWHAYIFVEGLRTTDGRAADIDAGTYRDLPLPITWQKKNEPGHMEAEVVGSMSSITRQSQDEGYALMYAEGTFDLGGQHGQEAARQVALQGGTRWVSADIEVMSSNWCSGNSGLPIEGDAFWDELFGGGDVYEVMTSYRIMGCTIVAKPAFPQCVIAPSDVALPKVEPMGIGTEPEPVQVPMLVASAVIVREDAAPAAWFAQPALSGPTPIHVTDDGRVYGHIADWNTPHTGYNGVKRYAPRNHSGEYRQFLTGEYPTADGSNVPVGTLTMGCGHADLSMKLKAARAHYDGGPGAVMAAYVAVGEDKWGIWCAGVMNSELNANQIREFMALSPSGDWRPMNGHLELVACCQVPVPGFPIPRSIAASAAGEADGRAWEHYEREGDEMVCTAMVAAGRVIHDPTRDMFTVLANRITLLEATVKAAGITASAIDNLAASIGL